MASGSITSWQLDGETVKTVVVFIFLFSKITVDSDCSHEIKRGLLLGSKVMTKLYSILKKQRHYFVNKVPSGQGMVFPVVMYGCESWTIKKAKCQRIDAFQMCCWRRPLRVPWTARRSNQSILKEISPGCSLIGLKLKLKLQYFGHLMQRADSFEKILMLGKIEGRKRRGWQRMRRLDAITHPMDMVLGGLQELVKYRETWRAVVHGVTNSLTRLSDWTELNLDSNLCFIQPSVENIWEFSVLGLNFTVRQILVLKNTFKCCRKIYIITWEYAHDINFKWIIQVIEYLYLYI